MKPGWEVKPLGEVCRLELGSTPQRKNPKFWDDEKITRNVWLSIADMTAVNGKKIDDSKEYVSDIAAAKMKLVPEGTLILSFKLSLGRVAITGRDLRTNEAIVAIHDLDAKRVNREYLYWYFSFFDWNAAAANDEKLKGKTLNKAKLKVQPVIIPPLEEQKRIVAVLDAAFEGLTRAKENAETNLQNARELFVACREEAFDANQEGWSLTKLETLFTIKHGFAFKSEFFTQVGDYVLLTPGNYFETGGYRDRGEKQKFYVGEIPEGYILHEGDLLVAMTEQAVGLLGSCILVPEPDRFLHNQRLGLIEAKEGIEWHAPFFAEAFNLVEFRQALTRSSTGIKVRHTSPSKIGDECVPVPKSLSEQIIVAEKLQAIQAEVKQAKAHYTTKLTDIADLRQSLLQKAFAGELT